MIVIEMPEDEYDRLTHVNGAPDDVPEAQDDPSGEILPIKQASQWKGADIPERQWLIPDRIPMHNVTLLSGEGSIGKSILIHQLAISPVSIRTGLAALLIVDLS